MIPIELKNLLGKTANLTFRLVSESEEDFGSEILNYEDSEGQLSVSKRIVLSGDNLINATPTFDNQINQSTVNISLDRAGTKKFARATKNNVGKRLAIILDNKIISAPVIKEAIIEW